MTANSLALPANVRPKGPARWTFWSIARQTLGWLLLVHGCWYIAHGLAFVAARAGGLRDVEASIAFGAGDLLEALLGIVSGALDIALGSSVRAARTTMTRKLIALSLLVAGAGGLSLWAQTGFQLEWAMFVPALAWIAIAPGIWYAREWALRALLVVGLLIFLIQWAFVVVMLRTEYFVRSAPLEFSWQWTMLMSLVLCGALVTYALLPATRARFAEAREAMRSNGATAS